jgi:hypothetical protein
VRCFRAYEEYHLSANEEAIERGRQVARNRKTTLNERVRNWLEQLGEGELREQAFYQQMNRMDGRIRVGSRKATTFLSRRLELMREPEILSGLLAEEEDRAAALMRLEPDLFDTAYFHA